MNSWPENPHAAKTPSRTRLTIGCASGSCRRDPPTRGRPAPPRRPDTATRPREPDRRRRPAGRRPRRPHRRCGPLRDTCSLDRNSERALKRHRCSSRASLPSSPRRRDTRPGGSTPVQLFEEADRFPREPHRCGRGELLPPPSPGLSSLPRPRRGRTPRRRGPGERELVRHARPDRSGAGDYDPRHGRDSARRARG
jgi:hypothetical protein